MRSLCSSPQSPRGPGAVSRERPKPVSEYSTRGGTASLGEGAEPSDDVSALVPLLRS